MSMSNQILSPRSVFIFELTSKAPRLTPIYSSAVSQERYHKHLKILRFPSICDKVTYAIKLPDWRESDEQKPAY